VAAQRYTGVYLEHICWLHRPVVLVGGVRIRENDAVEHQDRTECSILNIFNSISVSASTRGCAVERGGQNDLKWSSSYAVAR
jgi:hypothetical protein